MSCMADVMDLADTGNLPLIESAFHFCRQMKWHTLPGTYSSRFFRALIHAFRGHDQIEVARQLRTTLCDKTPAVITSMARAKFPECNEREALAALFDSLLTFNDGLPKRS